MNTSIKIKAPLRVLRFYSRKKKYWNAVQIEARRREIESFVLLANRRFRGEAFSVKETPHAFCVAFDKHALAENHSLYARIKAFFLR